MREQFLIGIDVGTQSAKVIVFRRDGSIVCEGRQPLRQIMIPSPRRAEHPDDDLWDSLQLAARQAMDRFQRANVGQLSDILAVGLCVIRCCRVLLREDGTLASPVISWMDERLNVPYQHSPSYGDVRYLTTASGYLTHRLTGCPKDTCANYIGWWPMDDVTLDWSIDPEDFRRCNTPREMLFDVVPPGEVLGQVTPAAAAVTGLPSGLPVVATAHDKAVEALGAGALGAGTALVSLGTYIGVMLQGQQHRPEAKHFWSFQASIPGHYLYECWGVRRGMWTVSWFCDQFGPGLVEEARRAGLSVEDYFNREAESVPAGSEGLITIHDWAPPPDATYRKGVILGFDGRHTRRHMYRSLLEGIAFTVKNNLDQMLDELGLSLEKLVISGGGANSDLFMKIFADLFGVSAIRNQMIGSAAVGCAINAGMAVGAFSSYDDAIEKFVHPAEEFTADLQHTRVYREINEKVYRQANHWLDPLLREHGPVVDGSFGPCPI